MASKMPHKASDVLLVGSMPLPTVAEVFSTVPATLPTQIKRLPDGEPPPRHHFIGFQQAVFPESIVRAEWGGKPDPAVLSSGRSWTAADLRPTGYAAAALSSYALFAAAKQRGAIPPAVRFQVCLPSPMVVVTAFVEPAVRDAVEPAYAELMRADLADIQDAVPPSELCVQWDLPGEIAALEAERGWLSGEERRRWTPSWRPVLQGVEERARDMATMVRPGVEVGLHLCYGDYGHKHFVEPEDTAVLVKLANCCVEAMQHSSPVSFVHMPVPKDRTDAKYFEALKDLDLKGGTLYLGLLHPYDEDGTRERMERAAEVLGGGKGGGGCEFGIATECGMGRFTADEFHNLLEISKKFT